MHLGNMIEAFSFFDLFETLRPNSHPCYVLHPLLAPLNL